MTPGMLVGLFLFVLAAVSAAGYLVVLRPSKAEAGEAAEANIPVGISLEHQDLTAAQAAFVGGFRALGESLPVFVKQENLQRQLIIAGYRWPSAVAIFLGIKAASALLCGIAAIWAAIINQSDVSSAVLGGVCGGGFGYLIPDQVLGRLATARVGRLRRGLPAALDLMVL